MQGTLVFEHRLATLSQGTRSTDLVDHRLALRLGASFAPIERLRVHLSAPFYLVQRGDASLLAPSDAEVDRGGVGDVLVTAKARLWGHDEGRRGLGVGASLSLLLPSGQQTRLQGEGLRAAPTVHVDYEHRRFSLAASARYLIRPVRELVGLQIDDALELGLAGRVSIGSSGLDAIVELDAAFGVQGSSIGEARTRPAMVHAALRGLHGPFVWTAGIGGGVSPGYAAPQLRLFGQFAYAPAELRAHDADDDGLVDRDDRCPRSPEDRDGSEDEDGCPDVDDDADGVHDAEDACARVAEDPDGFDDEDGCPELDNDHDERTDAEDRCPLVAEDRDGFEDDDGCVDVDNDRDTIADRDDHCPDAAGPIDGVPAGCPVIAPLETRAPSSIPDAIHFRTHDAQIGADERPVLDRIAALLVEHPRMRLQLIGHADRRGEAELNERLSLERAEAVRDYLVEHGVDRARLDVEGHGTREDADSRRDEAAYQRNRRVEFRVRQETSP